MKTFPLLFALFPLAALAGSTAPANMQAVSGSLVMPQMVMDEPAVGLGQNRQGDAAMQLPGQTLSFGLPVAIATLNRLATLEARAHPDPTQCRAHVLAVQRLAREGFSYSTGVPADGNNPQGERVFPPPSEWTVQSVKSAPGGTWDDRHASALVTAGDRSFLLDNGALHLNAGNWIEVTGVDRSAWDVSSP